MKIKFCSLSSGSSGNCQYIESSRTKFIVDAGLSGKRIKELLESIEVCPSQLNGILVSHEHTDHCCGVGILSRRYDLPVYANQATWRAMDGKIGKIKDKNIKVFNSEKSFIIEDLHIQPVRLYHDASEAVGFTMETGGKKISLITDTGLMDNRIVGEIENSDLYFIESNHDEDMLLQGSYPWHLKERILSNLGHMSNEGTGEVLVEALQGKGEKVILAHLSKENNLPQLALETVARILAEKGLDPEKDIDLQVSFRDKRTPIISL